VILADSAEASGGDICAKMKGRGMGETDLAALLRGMEPILHTAPYGFAVGEGALPFRVFATVAEEEGLTVVADLAALRAAGLLSDPWARISLTVHSDLEAVGLTAAFATALAGEGISCNVIAGVHHDHIFVQWDRRDDAMRVLKALADA
jgi:uncharacterized protein